MTEHRDPAVRVGHRAPVLLLNASREPLCVVSLHRAVRSC